MIVTVTKQNYYRYEQIVSAVIPVELISFNAEIDYSGVVLKWETATETNNRGFEIERKLKNFNWTVRGFESGFGTTTEPQEYSFIDNITDVTTNSISYRLKQIDFDGSFEYSKVVAVSNVVPTEFALEQNYPNPFNPITKIKFSIPYVETHCSASIQLKIYDALGREVAILIKEEKLPGNYEVDFNAGGLSSGVYFYKLQAGDYTNVKKMILLK